MLVIAAVLGIPLVLKHRWNRLCLGLTYSGLLRKPLGYMVPIPTLPLMSLSVKSRARLTLLNPSLVHVKPCPSFLRLDPSPTLMTLNYVLGLVERRVVTIGVTVCMYRKHLWQPMPAIRLKLVMSRATILLVCRMLVPSMNRLILLHVVMVVVILLRVDRGLDMLTWMVIVWFGLRVVSRVLVLVRVRAVPRLVRIIRVFLVSSLCVTFSLNFRVVLAITVIPLVRCLDVDCVVRVRWQVLVL